MCIRDSGNLGQFTVPRDFNMMLKTYLGVLEDESGLHYLRPETAQGIFVNFKNVENTSRMKVPFGIGQVGKSFRNEITPGNFISVSYTHLDVYKRQHLEDFAHFTSSHRQGAGVGPAEAQAHPGYRNSITWRRRT